VPAGAAEHDHRNLSHHQGVACNMRMVSHAAMTEQEGEFPGAHAVDVHEDLLVVSVEYGNEGRGFNLYDVSDPTRPTLLSEYRNPEASGGDRNIAFSADGQWLYMANEAGGQSTVTSAGVRLFDVSDPAQPVEVSFTPIAPSGVHTITAFAIGGTQYAAALNFGVHLLELRADALGTMRLVPVGRFATATPAQIAAHPEPSPTTLQRSVYGHDTYVEQDPETGQTLLYFAYAYDGARVLDISVPSAPQEVARWAPSDEGAPHYIHDVKPYFTQDGRRIMVVEAETFEDRHIQTPSPVWFVDITDFEAPTELFKWTNPGGHGSDQLGLSSHFFRIMDQRVYLSHYHGGVWVLDGRDPANVTELAYYMPAQDTGYTPSEDCCIGWNLGSIPMVFDVAVDERGYVYAADLATGLYVLEYTGG
jgi:hypothetical protein